MIEIENNKQQIVRTNYWDSEHAGLGYFYLSWNAGAARLLVPDNQKPALSEMKTAKIVIISRGQWRGRDALELLFEDNTDTPYVINVVAEQTDRMIPDIDQGGGFVVTAWTRQGKELSLTGKYRRVKELPCMQPWSEH